MVTLGKVLLLGGVGLVVVGGLLLLIGKGVIPAPPASWRPGQLPGDWRWQSPTGSVRIYVPLGTSLLLSLLLSFLWWLFSRRS